VPVGTPVYDFTGPKSIRMTMQDAGPVQERPVHTLQPIDNRVEGNVQPSKKWIWLLVINGLFLALLAVIVLMSRKSSSK
jgi:hypothetical protein